MKKTLSIAIAIAVAGMSSVASAEENMGLEFSADVAMSTDYVWHGITQTMEDPAISGSFGVSHSSGIYASIWASNVDFGDDADLEADYTLGWAGELGPVGIDVGYVGIDYPGATGYSLSNEFYIGVSGTAGPVDLSLYYTDDSDEYDWGYWSLGASAPVGDFTVAAHYGDHDSDAGGTDWQDWSVGASTELGGFGFDLTYYDTDMNAVECAGVAGGTGDDYCDGTVVFTLSKSL